MADFLSLLADAGDSLKPAKDTKILPLSTLCGNILLHKAIEEGDIKTVIKLLKLGISVHVRINGMSPIHHAVHSDFGDIIEILAEEGANIHEKIDGSSLLHLAVTKSNADAADALLSLGLNVYERDKDGLPLLYKAAEKDDIETAQILVDNGADIFTDLSPNCRSGRSLVHVAVSRSCVNAIHCFAKLGIDLDSSYYILNTPLCQAAEENKLQIMKELMKCGADINIRDHNGFSLLHLTIIENDLIAAQNLLDAGIDINVKGGWWGWTPLHLAADERKINFAKLLIQRNADIKAKTNDGRTPLDFAIKNNDIAMMTLINKEISKQ